MLHRSLTAVLVAIAVLALAPLTAAAQSAESEAPRTPWGAPDLQGVWDFRSLTPLERPEELGEKAFLTAEEAAALEQEAVQRNAELLNRPAESASAGGSVDVRDDGSPGFYNNFWLDGGTSTVDSRRTSLITHPPNGRMPPLTAAAAKRAEALAMERQGAATHEPTPGGWIHDLGPMGLQLRCITGFNSGPPMTPGFYNQNVQIFQTPEEVVLLNEMNHNFRIVPLDGRDTPGLPQWTGASSAHWDGDTLVVETKDFLRETSFAFGVTTRHLHVIERFTRASQDTLLYEVTADDPTVWQHPWSYELPMKWNDQPLYEYACHEGNYGLANILAGARAEEAAAAESSEQ